MSNQSGDMDILNALKNSIVNYWALIHVKLEIQKSTVKLLYSLDYLLFTPF